MEWRTKALWAIGYLGVTLVPLAVVLIGPLTPQRGFWIEFAVAVGFIGLAMMGLQSILTARLNVVSAAFGQDTLLQFHRQAGIVAFTLILAHPIILVAANPEFWSFFDPRVNLPRAFALVFVILALVTMIVTSLWRRQLGISYEWWRLGHSAIATVIIIIGLVHILQVRHYLDSPWKQALWASIVVVSILSIFYVRILTPLIQLRHPYRVVSVKHESHRTWTLTVVPESSSSFSFQAGQFAFLTIADSPFSLQQHPFSISSSAERPERLEFTIKELGDYTSRISEIEPGRRAYIDAPYGSLKLPAEARPGVVFIAGGIGITPIISMIRTLRDRGAHEPPLFLIYTADRMEDVAYASELDELDASEDFDFNVLYVLADPEADWEGESGFVTADLLARHLPYANLDKWHYVVCGPPPMMEVVEGALISMGVPLARIKSEQFDIEAAGVIGLRQAQVRRAVMALAVVMVIAAALFAW